MKKRDIDKKKIGLCLSGGGALGFAHIGLLRALEEADIHFDEISGTSMGAIIGVLTANGFSAEEIYKALEKHKAFDLTRLIHFTYDLKKGFSDHAKIDKMLRKLLTHNSFEKLKKPFYVCVVDLLRPEWEIIHSGDLLLEYVLASTSIPLVFKPNEMEGKLLVDGGVMNNLPVEPLLKSCDVIIASDVQPILPVNKVSGQKNLITRAYAAMYKEVHKKRIADSTYHISIPVTEKYSIYDFKYYKEIIEMGYLSAQEQIKKINL